MHSLPESREHFLILEISDVHKSGKNNIMTPFTHLLAPTVSPWLFLSYLYVSRNQRHTSLLVFVHEKKVLLSIFGPKKMMIIKKEKRFSKVFLNEVEKNELPKQGEEFAHPARSAQRF